MLGPYEIFPFPVYMSIGIVLVQVLISHVIETAILKIPGMQFGVRLPGPLTLRALPSASSSVLFPES